MTANGDYAHRCSPDHFEWRGEYVDLDRDYWWCPSRGEYVDCPGPCPDGREHTDKTVRTSRAKKMVHIGGWADD